jgi:hypothetical protein
MVAWRYALGGRRVVGRVWIGRAAGGAPGGRAVEERRRRRRGVAGRQPIDAATRDARLAQAVEMIVPLGVAQLRRGGRREPS